MKSARRGDVIVCVPRYEVWDANKLAECPEETWSAAVNGLWMRLVGTKPDARRIAGSLMRPRRPNKQEREDLDWGG